MNYMSVKQDGGFSAKVVLDSTCEVTGARVTTMECRYPRFIHSEIMTHRVFARNSASSRAIPFLKLMRQVQDDPVIPIRWGAEQKGMAQGQELDVAHQLQSKNHMFELHKKACEQAKKMYDEGLHKSICNRYIEPWMWITVIITATDWQNFFRQRCHQDAEPHMQKLAYLMKDAYDSIWDHQVLAPGHWHLPYVSRYDEVELREELLKHKDDVGLIQTNALGSAGIVENALCAISAARAARVSYLTHDGAKDWRKDLELFQKLVNGSGFGHWSPMEHPCRAEDWVLTHETDAYKVNHMQRLVRSGPFRGYTQFRKLFSNENGDA